MIFGGMPFQPGRFLAHQKQADYCFFEYFPVVGDLQKLRQCWEACHSWLLQIITEYSVPTPDEQTLSLDSSLSGHQFTWCLCSV